MKQDRATAPFTLLISAAILLGGAALAAERPEAPEGYLEDSRGKAVFDQGGDCVKTTDWKKGMPCPEAPAARVEPVKAATRPEKITISGETLFDFDKATLRPEGKRELARAIEEIRTKLQGLALEQRRITVTGHTDSVGSDAYNLKLSQRRAQAVKDFIVENGVEARVIEARGEGESQPVASNATAAGRQQNRRVEVDYQALARPKS